MEETNEISQGLKQVIHDYYMGYIKEKFSFFGEEGQEEKISSEIMQLIDSKIAEGNSSIDKDEITQILRTVMRDDFNDPMIARMRRDRISETFPDTATITIEEGQTAHLEELKKRLFGENDSKVGYLYVGNEYYDSHIQEIEAMIKQLERAFSSKDIEQFDEQFTKDATIEELEAEKNKKQQFWKNFVNTIVFIYVYIFYYKIMQKVNRGNNQMSLHKKIENNLNVISKNMREIRNDKNISLSNLSDKLMLMGIDISKQSLHRIENNQRSVRDYELSGIALALGVSTDELLMNFIESIK